LTFTPVSKVTKETRLATKVQPWRMAVIEGSFPYKKQVEEFKKALRLNSANAVFGERVRELVKVGDKESTQNLPGFRFRGMEVQRMTLTPDGRETVWDTQDDEGRWQSDEEYKRAVILTGKKFAGEHKEFADDNADAKFLASVSKGLVMKFPAQ